MRKHTQPLNRRRKSEGGYILVTLTLFVALMIVAAMAIAPNILFQIQRDREEEMIHRGVQYSRAIQKYYKKFGRYPTSLEELQNTNNIRCLRKRYKDPTTGKDFRLLHYSEVQMLGMGSGMAGATPVSSMQGAGLTGMNSTAGPGMGMGGPGQGSGAGGFLTSSTSRPSDQNPTDQKQPDQNPADQNPAGTSTMSQVIGGPIVGVISTNKAKSIREFGGKNHYNQWQFIFDPTMQMRNTGLINSPAQPMPQGAGNVSGMGTPAAALGSNQPSSNQSGQPSSSPGSFGSSTQPQGPGPLPQPQPPAPEQ